ncbi:DUF2470 domain-containing protein [Streptomyces halobius]|uniref:DUF2470 domain-containing protein n=1 Tax=Streptomyces halobius TaxID=2879846 RepID=A0ABY4MHV1_9ACTN|nr:DUF2470 domain-containing protein [Streptomyces halobius]UQA97389.1 DUF2470 domain-containing protein [Streptomyces halobius]
MSVTAFRATEPSAAEQARSVLAAAGSLTVSTDGYRCDLVGRHILDGKGRLWLRLPADGHLAARVACAPRGALAALLAFTDVAPIAVRDRVRSRLTLSGWLTVEDAEADSEAEVDSVDLRLDLARVTLETAAGAVDVGLDELVLAEADPLTAFEARMLTHLADAHPDAVAELTRLVDPRHLHGVVRVWPLALDRYAITLRLEHARSHHDVRLPFPTPLREANQITRQIQTLLALARTCPRRRRPVTRP